MYYTHRVSQPMGRQTVVLSVHSSDRPSSPVKSVQEPDPGAAAGWLELELGMCVLC